jgi:hypothetical protein
MLTKTITIAVQVTDQQGMLQTYAQHVAQACSAHSFPAGVLRIEYEGSGDSGSVTACSFEPDVATAAHPVLSSVQLYTCSGKVRCEKAEGKLYLPPLYELDSVYRPLEGVLEEMAFLALACAGWPGWEVNEGSQGHLLVTLPEGSLRLLHTEFFQSSATHECELNFDGASDEASAEAAAQSAGSTA